MRTAIISDTHFGSKYADVRSLIDFLQYCKEKNVGNVVIAGDIVEGLMPRPGHAMERTLHSIDEISKYCTNFFENYLTPFKVFLIVGNHDESLNSRSYGFDIGLQLQENFSNVVYREFVRIDDHRVYIFHGRGGCPGVPGARGRQLYHRLQESAYKNIDVLIMGHCHTFSADYIGNVIVVAAPSFQRTTPYLASKLKTSEVGGLILESQKFKNVKIWKIDAKFYA